MFLRPGTIPIAFLILEGLSFLSCEGQAQFEHALQPAVAETSLTTGRTTGISLGGDDYSSFLPQFHPEFMPPALLIEPSNELRLSADNDEDAGTPAPSVSGGHVDLLPLLAKWKQEAAQQGPAKPQKDREGYHWKGLLWQSFAFFGVENSFRLMTDPYFRHLTAESPYWHNYTASLKQWNWRRWSDGDDFLVAYVGHPMQGAVTSFIAIQNDPHARYLELSATAPYWKSRFWGLMWNNLYSIDQKIGPLGETALGSEGGYTYVIGCPAPCPSYNPAVDKVTNNTGWVKLVSTPVVGTLWGLAEDFLDRYVSDRVQDDNMKAKFPKILRGSLNPARTMANALRGKTPWYRDFQHPEPYNVGASGVHFIRDDEDVIRNLPRFEVFPHFNAFSLPVNDAGCSHCRQITTGSGVGFSSRLTRWVDFDSDVDYQPNASPLLSDRAGGDIIMGTFGLRSGFQTRRYSLKASLRPGFVSYNRAYLTSPSKENPQPEIGRITHFATVLAITGDYGIGRHFALRASFGNTPVRYREPYVGKPGIGKLPYLNWLSKETFLTNENWNYQGGPVLRF
jgi:hypothetical protein